MKWPYNNKPLDLFGPNVIDTHTSHNFRSPTTTSQSAHFFAEKPLSISKTCFLFVEKSQVHATY